LNNTSTLPLSRSPQYHFPTSPLLPPALPTIYPLVPHYLPIGQIFLRFVNSLNPRSCLERVLPPPVDTVLYRSGVNLGLAGSGVLDPPPPYQLVARLRGITSSSPVAVQ
jgi:hypothetical protein